MGFFGYMGDWINQNPGKAVGIACGLLFGILLFAIGILKTLLIVLFMLIGYLIGKSRDENVSIIDTVARLFRRDR